MGNILTPSLAVSQPFTFSRFRHFRVFALRPLTSSFFRCLSRSRDPCVLAWTCSEVRLHLRGCLLPSVRIRQRLPFPPDPALRGGGAGEAGAVALVAGSAGLLDFQQQ